MWGPLTAAWVPHDTRDIVVDFVNKWALKTELAVGRFISWLGIARGKFYEWRKRYGKANEHNALIPRDHWITDEERQAILDFELLFPREGYRRLTFMMLDRDVVAVSPSTVYRVPHAPAASIAGTGIPPTRARASSSPSGRTSIGTSTSPTSMCPVRSTICAQSSTA